MSTEGLQNNEDRKQIELDSLLEVCMAINANMDEPDLYRILLFTCISNLNVNKISLFVKEEEWECKISHGANREYFDIAFPAKLMRVDDVTFLDPFAKFDGFEEFDVIIPVAHKKKMLAYILVSGLERFVVEGNAVITFIQTLTNIVMVAIENKRMARKQLVQETINKELEIARKVQKMLFPKSLPDNESISIYTTYFPHRSVGGDYYDYIELPDEEFLICVADVSGKGVPAAMLMSNFQASLRTLARLTKDLVEIVNDLNYQIISNAEGESFITAFVGIYNPESRKLKYINAGHNAPFLCNNGELTELKEGTTVLGAFDRLPFVNTGEVDVPVNSLLFNYTDGLTETTNPVEEEFGEERLKEFLKPRMDLPVEVLHIQLIDEIDGFKEHLDYRDDLTILSCRLY